MEIAEDKKVLVPIYIDKDELWSEVFGSAYESMDWWLDEEFLTGDWEHHGEVRISYEDEDENPQKMILKIEDIARGYALALENGYHHCGSYVDIRNMDACAGDIVLQCAIFGQVIYG
jgi:hypothetical protein